jgi:hypothetical protein
MSLPCQNGIKEKGKRKKEKRNENASHDCSSLCRLRGDDDRTAATGAGISARG